jgi:hypothetical protein
MPKEIYYLNLGEGEMGSFPLKFIINMVNEKAFSWVEGFTMVTIKGLHVDEHKGGRTKRL